MKQDRIFLIKILDQIYQNRTEYILDCIAQSRSGRLLNSQEFIFSIIYLFIYSLPRTDHTVGVYILLCHIYLLAFSYLQDIHHLGEVYSIHAVTSHGPSDWVSFYSHISSAIMLNMDRSDQSLEIRDSLIFLGFFLTSETASNCLTEFPILIWQLMRLIKPKLRYRGFI